MVLTQTVPILANEISEISMNTAYNTLETVAHKANIGKARNLAYLDVAARQLGQAETGLIAARNGA